LISCFANKPHSSLAIGIHPGKAAGDRETKKVCEKWKNWQERKKRNKSKEGTKKM
jgi:hypothetical protein